jgi:hypothetical protein
LLCHSEFQNSFPARSVGFADLSSVFLISVVCREARV